LKIDRYFDFFLTRMVQPVMKLLRLIPIAAISGIGFSLIHAWCFTNSNAQSPRESLAVPSFDAITFEDSQASEVFDAAPTPGKRDHESEEQARELIQRVIDSIATGRAFDAKVRQRVWTSGREMVGVGTYEQAGGGTGQFNLQVNMHDGDGKHTLQQISDGRLTWTRTEIDSKVTLKRVDVGRLSEWATSINTPHRASPRLRVGAWTELLDSLAQDYQLRLTAGRLESHAVWIVAGTLRPEIRQQVLSSSGGRWPELYPTQIRVAIAATSMSENGFGEGLPVRVEYWSEPVQAQATDTPSTAARMIMLVELYSIRQIEPPPLARFRYENQDVNFLNETDRYLRKYGIELSDADRRRLRR
jgi:hypothetical protein